MQHEGVSPQLEHSGYRMNGAGQLQSVAMASPASTGPGERLRSIVAHLSVAARQLHLRYHLANVAAGLLPNFAGAPIRTRLYRLAGFRNIARRVAIAGNIHLVGAQIYDKLFIGEGAMVAYDVTMSLDGPVHIEEGVSIGPSVKIYTGTHTLGPGSNRRHHKLIAMPVTIGAGSWLGVGAIVLPGVTIGRGSVVSAGSVVTEDVPPNSYVAGNPAQVIRTLPWGNR